MEMAAREAFRRLRWHGAPFGVTEVGLVLGYIGSLGLIAQLALLPVLVKRCAVLIVNRVHKSLPNGAILTRG